MARSGKIPFWVKFNFGFGQIGEAAFSAITLTFVTLYYNQALGLNIDLVGWALGLAIFSPIAGSLCYGIPASTTKTYIGIVLFPTFGAVDGWAWCL